MAKLTLVTGPATTVITADDLKTHSRISFPDEDDYLRQLLDIAETAAEDNTWRRLLTQTWDQKFDRFANPLTLRNPPVQSITSVTYVDTAGVTQTLSTDIYEQGEDHEIGTVRLKSDQQWPTVQSHQDVVTVRFVAGYGDDTEDVPVKIRHAIRLHATHHWRNREGQPMPRAWKDLLSPYSVRRFFTDKSEF